MLQVFDDGNPGLRSSGTLSEPGGQARLRSITVSGNSGPLRASNSHTPHPINGHQWKGRAGPLGPGPIASLVDPYGAVNYRTVASYVSGHLSELG